MEENTNPTIRDPQSYIGYVVGGALKDTLSVRLDVSPQTVQEGAFVVIQSGNWLFYGLTTDLVLGSTDPRFADEKSEERLPAWLAAQLHGQTLFTNLSVLPALMVDRGPEYNDPHYDEWIKNHPGTPRPMMVKTIPSHHANAYLASPYDIEDIFGETGKPGNFVIGHTREQGHPIALDLEKFVQRSSGIFGATGTGKSFLTRIILAGLIHYDKASVLVFDMHNEYGLEDIASDTRQTVPGLKTKFPAKVRVVGLGAGAMIHGIPPDFNLQIAERDISPADIEMLTRELNLKETTPTTLDALYHSFGPIWFHEFRKMTSGEMVEDPETGKKVPANGSVEYWAREAGMNEMAAAGLRSKLNRVFNLDYIVEKPASNGLAEIIKALEAGQHVVLSFGDHESDLDYLLVSNLLTRRIRERWEELTNEFKNKKAQGGKEPRPLVIAVEEAHKLLNREMAAQTAFSTIAREMRKYYVTLLIIDQRPSQIYDEVMSQLGTRVTGWLGDDADIAAVLSGLAGRDALRGMLARLQPKEEVLMLGWGTPMPILVRSRRYDDKFWQDLLGKNQPGSRSLEDLQSLWG
jgi:DNA helicase HerA-like ATPase